MTLLIFIADIYYWPSHGVTLLDAISLKSFSTLNSEALAHDSMQFIEGKEYCSSTNNNGVLCCSLIFPFKCTVSSLYYHTMFPSTLSLIEMDTTILLLLK